jgi:hypothetical protein
MDDLDDQSLAALLGDACAASSGRGGGVVSVASALRPRVDETDAVRALIAGLEFHLRLDDEGREPYGPFGPMMEFDGRAYPAPLDRIDDAVPGTLALWARAVELAPVALVRARYADLLWVARFGDRPHEYAQRAIDEYLAAAHADFGHPLELGDAVQRAVEVATEINDATRRLNAVAVAVDLIDAAVDSPERAPGVALRLLDMFVRARPDGRPTDLESLLGRAIDRFGDDPWQFESMLEMRAQLAEAKDRPAIMRTAAEAFRDHARSTKGLARFSHLQHALELAAEHGLSALAEEIRLEIEAMSEDEFELHTISTEVTLPREQIDAFIDHFVGDDNLESALDRFAAYVPTGDPESTRAFVDQQMAEHPLQFSVTKMRLGPENSLISTTVDADDHVAQAMIEHESFSASLHSLFAVDILTRVGERYGNISAAAHWFESPLIDAPTASRVCRAIELYELGDYDSSASLLAPRLERIVRGIARSVGLTVTRSPDRQGRPGGVKTLGSLLQPLRHVLPEST